MSTRTRLDVIFSMNDVYMKANDSRIGIRCVSTVDDSTKNMLWNRKYACVINEDIQDMKIHLLSVLNVKKFNWKYVWAEKRANLSTHHYIKILSLISFGILVRKDALSSDTFFFWIDVSNFKWMDGVIVDTKCFAWIADVCTTIRT